MNKGRIFIFFWLFYIFWVFINNWLEKLYLSLSILWVIVVFFLILVLRTKKYGIILLFSVLWCVLWIYLSDYNLEKIDTNLDLIRSFDGEKVKQEVEIVRTSKVTDERIVYLWKVLDLDWQKIDRKIFSELYISWNKKFEKWEILAFESKIYEYEDFNNFEYQKYMLSSNIYYKTYPYNSEIIWQNEVNFIVRKITFIREDILAKIKEIYSKEEAIFLWWILVWARENLPKTLSDNFNNSWLTHFIAVSGFNITILIVFFGYLIKFFPPIIRFILISVVIILFTILVWYNAPVIRASIMWIIWYFVLISGRKWDIFAIVILTSILMITYSPLSINYDVSLHLSLLAVLWIIYTQAFFEKRLSFITNFFEIRTAFSLTLSALIFTFPIMMFNFWQISLIAPITNVLVSWTMPIIMLIWFLSIIIYYFIPFLWIIFWYFARILLKWDILIVNTFWQWKYSVIKYDFWEYKWYFEVMYFLILLFVVIWFKKEKKENLP